MTDWREIALDLEHAYRTAENECRIQREKAEVWERQFHEQVARAERAESERDEWKAHYDRAEKCAASEAIARDDAEAALADTEAK